VGSAVLITDGDRILLGLRNKEPNFGRWVLPGGGIEYGETHEQAAIREAKEELGVEIEILGLAGKGVYHILPPDRHRMIVYNQARIVGGEIVPSSDISEVRLFTRIELREADITPVVEAVLRDSGWLT
jgi:8-oxo-dGTP diphosphatase